LSAEDLDRLGGFKRYSDEDDGTGVGPRTLPGTDHPLAAYFTRGSGHNASAEYTEKPDEWQANMERLARKHEFARTLVPAPVLDEMGGAEVGIISYGSNDPAIREARDMLTAAGMKTSYLRLRALPTTKEFQAFVAKYDRLYVVENNFDGQMRHILQTDAPAKAAAMRGITLCDGLPLTGLWIAQSIVTSEQEW
jgi:2-oxoglutarate ferredoxin oxidoreductase subunit alpha